MKPPDRTGKDTSSTTCSTKSTPLTNSMSNSPRSITNRLKTLLLKIHIISINNHS